MILISKRKFECGRCGEVNSSVRWNFRTVDFVKKHGMNTKFVSIGKGMDDVEEVSLSYICPGCKEKVGKSDITEIN